MDISTLPLYQALRVKDLLERQKDIDCKLTIATSEGNSFADGGAGDPGEKSKKPRRKR